MIETGNIYIFKEPGSTRYALVLKPEAHPGFTRAILATDREFTEITCRMNIPTERFSKSDMIGRMPEEELSERMRKARRRSSELDGLLGKTVTITFQDNETYTDVLEYVPDYCAQYGYRRPGYYVGNLSFSKSTVKKVERSYTAQSTTGENR